MNSIIRHIGEDHLHSIQIYSNGIKLYDKCNNEQTLITGKKIKPIQCVEIFGHDDIPSLVEITLHGGDYIEKYYGRDLTVIVCENN